MKIYKHVLCKKNLFKSTYNDYAFEINKYYSLEDEDSEFYFIKDSTGHKFNFSKEVDGISYWIDDYFE
jgi:hypothetical protein